jgi:hypothetical protein
MSSRAVAPLPHRRRIPMPAIHNVVQQVAALRGDFKTLDACCCDRLFVLHSCRSATT